MKFDYRSQNEILKNFPNIELSYEKKLHKKVQTDIYITIPKGKKYFAWFKYFNGKNICFLLEINRRLNKIEKITYNICSFDKILCSGIGTILYGTLFTINNISCFNIENIYYFKGNNIAMYNQLNKLKEIKSLMKHYIKQHIYYKKSVVFGTPIYSNNYYDLRKIIETLPYDVYAIQYRLLYKNKPFLNETITCSKNIEKIFLVKATLINDIYDLYYNDNNEVTQYNIACIPDYKTSVMMNSLFRNIKENINLDYLEESDDEDEFENINEDKFVDLNKSYKMKCVYISKFGLWKPIEVMSTHDNICDKREIHFYKKK